MHAMLKLKLQYFGHLMRTAGSLEKFLILGKIEGRRRRGHQRRRWLGGIIDTMDMDKVVRLCSEKNVAVGAHPGYPDLMGFGRRKMNLSFDEIRNYMKYQLGALSAFTASYGIRIQHISPHGALGNLITSELEPALAVCAAVAEYDPEIIITANAGGRMIEAAKEYGLRYSSQVYADRAYNDDYSLVSRGTPGAMITDPDESVERVIRMVKEGVVTSISGKELPIQADAVCVHGDTATAVKIVADMRARIEAAGIKIAPIAEVIADRWPNLVDSSKRR